MDRRAWWATVCGVTKSWTHERLSRAQHNIPLCMYMCVYMYMYTYIPTHNIFIHSSVDGHLTCFYVLAVVNSASVNTGVHVSF